MASCSIPWTGRVRFIVLEFRAISNFLLILEQGDHAPQHGKLSKLQREGLSPGAWEANCGNKLDLDVDGQCWMQTAPPSLSSVVGSPWHWIIAGKAELDVNMGLRLGLELATDHGITLRITLVH